MTLLMKFDINFEDLQKTSRELVVMHIHFGEWHRHKLDMHFKPQSFLMILRLFEDKNMNRNRAKMSRKRVRFEDAKPHLPTFQVAR